MPVRVNILLKYIDIVAITLYKVSSTMKADNISDYCFRMCNKVIYSIIYLLPEK